MLRIGGRAGAALVLAAAAAATTRAVPSVYPTGTTIYDPGKAVVPPDRTTFRVPVQ